MKNKKLKNILSFTGYFLLVIALCVSASIVFHNVYYEAVYVSGSSMSPTLTGCVVEKSSYGFDVEKAGSIVDYGIVDTHKAAKNNIKRFSIVSTYFPDDYDASGTLANNPNQKIKRVVALPGETFKIVDSKLYIKKGNDFEYIQYKFDIDPAVDAAYQGKDIEETTLNNDEYWVLGDHRDKSRDSGYLFKENGDVHQSAIKKDYIVGVLVAIEGQATLKLKSCRCDKCGQVYSEDKVVCGNTSCIGHRLIREFELVNKKAHWPKYF